MRLRARRNLPDGLHSSTSAAMTQRLRAAPFVRCRQGHCARRAKDCEGLGGIVAAPRPARSALRVYVERIERMACRHKQPIALYAAKTDIGASLGQTNKTDRLTRGIEYFDAVLFLIAHAPA